MRRFLRRVWHDEAGATMFEYVVMAAFIGAALAGVVTALGGSIAAKFQATTARFK